MEIENHHLTRDEAKELRASPRRRATTKYIEQEMRVVDVNTADASHTTVVIEDLDTDAQHRVTFRDALIAEGNRSVVFAALAERTTAIFKLKVRQAGDDVISVEIMDVTQTDNPVD